MMLDLEKQKEHFKNHVATFTDLRKRRIYPPFFRSSDFYKSE